MYIYSSFQRLKYRMMVVTPMLFLSSALFFLAYFTWGYALLGIFCAWVGCAYLVQYVTRA